ncbi:MAG TPA: MMPL family transporter [Gammaproteobacteria bacterium]|nr:MMPL family transporter [Gammaproteobacteria bacterium]
MPILLKYLPREFAAFLVACATRWPWLVILVMLALTGWGVRYTAAHIGIDTDTGEMIDPKLPHRQASRALDEAFPHLPGDVLVYAQAAHAGDAEDAADALAAALRERPDIARALSQPGGGEFFARQGLLYLSVDELWTLDEKLADAAPLLGTLAADASLRGLFDTLSLGLDEAQDESARANLARLFDRVSAALERYAAGDTTPNHWREELFDENEDGGPARAFVLIDPALANTSFQPAEPAIEALHGLLDELQRHHPQVQYRVTGSAAMNGEELVTVAEDASLTTGLSFAFVALVLVWGLRRGGLVLAVLVTLACGLALTAAFAAGFVGSLNLISVCFAVLFIGMGVDFGIQFVLRYQEESRHGIARRAALLAAARGVGGALILAAAGAAISFSAFVPTSYKGLAQLGIISSCSMAIALLANLTLLPALLVLLPAPKAKPAPVRSREPGFVARHAKAILAVSALLTIVSLALLPRARFDLNPLNLKDPRSPAVRAFKDLASTPGASPYTIDLLAPTLAAADALAARIGALPEVDEALTLSSYVAADQEEKLGIIDGMRMSLGALMEASTTPAPTLAEERAAIDGFATELAAAKIEDATLAAAAARLARALDALRARGDWPDTALPAVRGMLLGDLPRTLARLRGLLEAEAFDVGDLPEDLRHRYVAADGRARVEVLPRADLNDNGAMQAFARAVQAVEPSATGAPIELVAGSEAVIESCVKASLGALLVTLVMHIVVLRGFVDALLVSAPLVLAMLLTVATSVLFRFPFNFANIIALPLLIGLNNAYGAYLVVRRQHAEGVATLLGSSTPRAVLFSGLTAIASFGTLGVSKHPGMAGMGILIALSLSYALICALLMLPALMAVLERKNAH